MQKKLYLKPAVQVVELQESCGLMAGSGGQVLGESRPSSGADVNDSGDGGNAEQEDDGFGGLGF